MKMILEWKSFRHDGLRWGEIFSIERTLKSVEKTLSSLNKWSSDEKLQRLKVPQVKINKKLPNFTQEITSKKFFYQPNLHP